MGEPAGTFVDLTFVLHPPEMPAIDLSRLKTQAARLSERFADPDAFVQELQALLDFYTNLTIRTAQTTRRLSLPTYRTPKPVLRQIELELETLAEAHPTEAIALTDALWNTKSLETHLLAASLLGMIPPAQAMPGLTRLPSWLSQSTDEIVRKALLNEALERLRRENPEALFLLLEDWLKSPHSMLQIWGLRALIPLLNQPDFENLPAVFRIVRPTIERASPSTQLELQECLEALARVSLTETLFFLRELLRSGRSHPTQLRTLRRMLPALSPALQSGLREALRETD
jgi:hypothetical protein